METPHAPSTLAFRKEAVLIVDDEPEIRATLAATFRRALPDVEVVTAEDGESGLEVLRARSFDLVLSDHCMPGMGGLDLLAHARELQPESVRVLMTAHPELDLVVRGKNEVLLQRFLTKPFRPREVVGVVQDLLGERRSRLMKEQAFQRSLALAQRHMDARAEEPAPAAPGA